MEIGLGTEGNVTSVTGADKGEYDDESGQWTIDYRGVWFRTSGYGYEDTPDRL